MSPQSVATIGQFRVLLVRFSGSSSMITFTLHPHYTLLTVSCQKAEQILANLKWKGFGTWPECLENLLDKNYQLINGMKLGDAAYSNAAKLLRL